MQFSSLLLSASAFVASTLAYQIQLTASDFRNIVNFDNDSIYPIHEGAGINYLQVGNGTDSEVLEFDEENGLIYKEVESANSIAYNLTLSVIENSRIYQGFPFLQLSVLDPNVQWSVTDDGKLYGDGASSEHFYVATDVNDPYNYYENFFIGYGDLEIFYGQASNITRVEVSVVRV